MSAITTHVLDTSCGRPAEGIDVVLEALEPNCDWRAVGSSRTDQDGRVRDGLSPRDGMPSGVPAGTYRLRFDTGAYFRTLGLDHFFPEVVIVFAIKDPTPHHHVPLLLSPFGYSTYRGS
jgi:5-hydroxyisourate hydrolase